MARDLMELESAGRHARSLIMREVTGGYFFVGLVMLIISLSIISMVIFGCGDKKHHHSRTHGGGGGEDGGGGGDGGGGHGGDHGGGGHGGDHGGGGGF